MAAEPARRRRLGPVRTRVTIVATGLVFCMLAATGWLLVVAQRRALTNTLEEAIAAKAAEAVSLARQDRARTPITGFGDDDAVVQVVDGTGVVVASTANIVGEPPLVGRPPGGRRWRTVRGLPADASAFRVLSVRGTGASGPFVVHVGASLDDIKESTALLGRSLAVGVPLVTGLLGVLVWAMIGRALRPVEAIRSEVSAIGGAELHRRVPEPGTDDEIDRLARTMNAMLDRVENAAVRQQAFVADASHELRSPLTRMRSELEVDLAHPARTDALATHRSVLEEAVGLQQLVDDLLLLARSDAGTAGGRRDPVDLDEVLARLAARAVAAGVDVDLRDIRPVQVRGDGGQLERAIGNVVDNAVRHADGRLTFTLSVRDGRAELSVADDGPGVPPEHRERVFERFARVDESRGTATGGTGLGLAIARDVVQRHGGTIVMESAEGPGARVVVRLPLG